MTKAPLCCAEYGTAAREAAQGWRGYRADEPHEEPQLIHEPRQGVVSSGRSRRAVSRPTPSASATAACSSFI